MANSIDEGKGVQGEELVFTKALCEVIRDLSPRSQEIIFSRYGIKGDAALTLEEIGGKYTITRERVRQVIREALKKVKEKDSHPEFMKIKETVILAITKNSGIISRKKLLKVLGKENLAEQAAVRFFLECISQVKSHEVKGEMSFSYSLSDFDLEKWRKAKDVTLSVFKREKRPLTADELFEFAVGELESDLSRDHFVFHLEISQEIKQNNFGKWGSAKWKEISPKGTREKAYLILKEAGKPLHFREIAKKIDLHKLSKKKTHPQTVHNELIKDKNFVLVGRGIYALSEWGYQRGTVKDVIKEIILKSPKPLTKDEILKKVLEIRQVKKSTIVINLNNCFLKSKEGFYSLKK
ncbi:MAG: hypothetical protein HGA61_03680 [Candidatus Moranbacteria bacterium]|nr:hypothetical protein [Candidatus Moranbacteria bacterium]